jgi:hypothetical protein
MKRSLTQFGIWLVAWVFVTQTATTAFASLILSDPLDEAASVSAGMEANSQNPPQHEAPPAIERVTDQQNALPGSGASSTSVTSTSAGHAALVVPFAVVEPALVARIQGEIKLIFPEPPPLGLLRPPKA